VIGVGFARQARQLVTPAGLEVDYTEFDRGQVIEAVRDLPTGAGTSQ